MESNYTQDWDALINAQCKIEAENLNYLNDTDYKVIREKETGEPVGAEITAARAAARLAVQAARTERERLEEEKRKEEPQEDYD